MFEDTSCHLYARFTPPPSSGLPEQVGSGCAAREMLRVLRTTRSSQNHDGTVKQVLIHGRERKDA